MDNKVFPQMNTLVKMRELTLLTESQKAELSRAADAQAALKILGSTSFFLYGHADGVEAIDQALQAEKQGWIDWCRKDCENDGIADVFSLPQSIHNLKVFVKERVTGSDLSALYFHDGDQREALDALLGAKDAELASEAVQKKAVLSDAIADFGVHQSFSRIDLLLSFYGQAQLLKLAAQIGDESITAFIQAQIDLDLLSTVLQTRDAKSAINQAIAAKAVGGLLHPRAPWLLSATKAEQDAYLKNTPYAHLWELLQDKSKWAFFDVYADNYLLGKCKKAKLEAFGVFPLFAVVYAKLLDIKNVRTLIGLKRAKAKTQQIDERMREGYGL